jgi:exonuclease III
MRLKVATWNMGHWQHLKKADEAWNYLGQIIDPDIALVQEAKPVSKGFGFIGKALKRSNHIAYSEAVVWRKIGKNRNWGSGVLTKDLPIREVTFENSYPGCLVAAEVMLPDNSLLTAISLYGIIDECGYSITTLHRMLSDLTPLLAGFMGKRRILIGGDFNASTQYDEKQPGESHRIFFERLKNFGLVDCLSRFQAGHVQTLRHVRSNYPWQNDYIFAFQDLADKLQSCEVINDHTTYELSDHNPVVAVFDL